LYKISIFAPVLEPEAAEQNIFHNMAVYPGIAPLHYQAALATMAGKLPKLTAISNFRPIFFQRTIIRTKVANR
jgi:hypothetical protein